MSSLKWNWITVTGGEAARPWLLWPRFDSQSCDDSLFKNAFQGFRVWTGVGERARQHVFNATAPQDISTHYHVTIDAIAEEREKEEWLTVITWFPLRVCILKRINVAECFERFPFIIKTHARVGVEQNYSRSVPFFKKNKIKNLRSDLSGITSLKTTKNNIILNRKPA